MSKTYSREAGSKFPVSLLDMRPVKDIDDTVKDIVMQYYSFILDGNINSAMALKENHPELDDYWVDASKVNLIREELYNIGIFAQKLRTNVVSDTEPELDYDDNTLWYQEIK